MADINPKNLDPKNLFFTQTDLDLQQAVKFTENALHGADDGELYLEYTLSEAFSFDDNRLKAASFDTAQGFGLRAVNDEAVGYAHATDLSPAALKRAADSLTPVCPVMRAHGRKPRMWRAARFMSPKTRSTVPVSPTRWLCSTK